MGQGQGCRWPQAQGLSDGGAEQGQASHVPHLGGARGAQLLMQLCTHPLLHLGGAHISCTAVPHACDMDAMHVAPWDYTGVVVMATGGGLQGHPGRGTLPRT